MKIFKVQCEAIEVSIKLISIFLNAASMILLLCSVLLPIYYYSDEVEFRLVYCNCNLDENIFVSKGDEERCKEAIVPIYELLSTVAPGFLFGAAIIITLVTTVISIIFSCCMLEKMHLGFLCFGDFFSVILAVVALIVFESSLPTQVPSIIKFDSTIGIHKIPHDFRHGEATITAITAIVITFSAAVFKGASILFY
ncbi:unnamed protein product [Bursaphelenchus xylophilus]|uniref:(pine wood nematode) hypothetical protein n=1 Tax=Bursaphelenchus xylophilus TaxID=6326 RepID=A0A1I7SV33_BURXY|nr:unnamed protein product [Bursaphelenchus xylophilus]CAG9100835.1 unnamed protein product [Bursaphelenchus xylophilus]